MAFQVVWGLWNPESTICPFQARKWLFQTTFEGKMANFVEKKLLNREKKRQKDKWYPFHACTGGIEFEGGGIGGSGEHLALLLLVL